jgi:hypothetical protein
MSYIAKHVELIEAVKTKGDPTADPEHDPLLHEPANVLELEHDAPEGPPAGLDPAP